MKRIRYPAGRIFIFRTLSTTQVVVRIDPLSGQNRCLVPR